MSCAVVHCCLLQVTSDASNRGNVIFYISGRAYVAKVTNVSLL